MQDNQAVADLLAKIEGVVMGDQAAQVLLGAAKLERLLALYLGAEMRKEMREPLFGPNGDVDFALKTDLCYALKLIPQEVYKDLKVVRRIRNLFAHAHNRITLKSPEIIKELTRAEGYKAKEDAKQFYEALFARTLDGLAKAMQKHAAKSAVLLDAIKTLTKSTETGDEVDTGG